MMTLLLSLEGEFGGGLGGGWGHLGPRAVADGLLVVAALLGVGDTFSMEDMLVSIFCVLESFWR